MKKNTIIVYMDNRLTAKESLIDRQMEMFKICMMDVYGAWGVFES